MLDILAEVVVVDLGMLAALLVEVAAAVLVNLGPGARRHGLA
jgi:hypothetical protein